MHKTHIKICGITNLADAQVAVAAGADLLGFILYAKSPRYVAREAVAEIVREVRRQKLEVRFIGVFVNELAEKIAETLRLAALDYAQLHGDEAPPFLTTFAGRAYKAIRPANAAAAAAESAQFAPLGIARGPSLLIDAYDPHAYGGTGQKADWHAAATVAQQHPGLLLAGGLTAENVAAAIRLVQPWGVDVSSGVEAAPGRKDHGKVQAFVAAVRDL